MRKKKIKNDYLHSSQPRQIEAPIELFAFTTHPQNRVQAHIISHNYRRIIEMITVQQVRNLNDQFIT
jgi:hypothetical protein